MDAMCLRRGREAPTLIFVGLTYEARVVCVIPSTEVALRRSEHYVLIELIQFATPLDKNQQHRAWLVFEEICSADVFCYPCWTNFGFLNGLAFLKSKWQ